MGLATKPLKETVTFEQMDSTPMGRNACDSKMEKVPMGMGEHWKPWFFIVAPEVQYTLVLGIRWLCEHIPCIDWSEESIWKEAEQCKSPVWKNERGPKIMFVNERAGLSKMELNTLSTKYQDMAFVLKLKKQNTCPSCDMDCSTELLPGQKCPKVKYTPWNPAERKELRKFMTRIWSVVLFTLWIPSILPWCCFGKKKAGGLCLCMDYRGLNVVSMFKTYPIPIKDLLEPAVKGKIFSKLDLRDAYFWVRIKDEWKMAFNSPLGQFTWLAAGHAVSVPTSSSLPVAQWPLWPRIRSALIWCAWQPAGLAKQTAWLFC